MLLENPTTKLPEGQGESPGKQRQVRTPGDVIQELQKAVKALQTSVDILSTRTIEGDS